MTNTEFQQFKDGMQHLLSAALDQLIAAGQINPAHKQAAEDAFKTSVLPKLGNGLIP